MVRQIVMDCIHPHNWSMALQEHIYIIFIDLVFNSAPYVESIQSLRYLLTATYYYFYIAKLIYNYASYNLSFKFTEWY